MWEKEREEEEDTTQLVERLFACPLLHLRLRSVVQFCIFIAIRVYWLGSAVFTVIPEERPCLPGGVISHRRNLLIPPAAVQWQRGKEMDGWVGCWKEQSPDGLSLKRPVCNKSKRASVSEKLNNTL